MISRTPNLYKLSSLVLSQANSNNSSLVSLFTAQFLYFPVILASSFNSILLISYLAVLLLDFQRDVEEVNEVVWLAGGAGLFPLAHLALGDTTEGCCKCDEDTGHLV